MTDDMDLEVRVAEGLDRILADHQWGQLTVWRDWEGVHAEAIIRPGMDVQKVAKFKGWALAAVDQFSQPGDPAAKGWNPSGCRVGAWYMTAAEYVLPSMD